MMKRDYPSPTTSLVSKFGSGRSPGALLSAAIAAAGIAGACGGYREQEGGEGDAVCAPGSESCECYGNGTCDADLTCLSDRCVDTEGDSAADPIGDGDGAADPIGDGDGAADPIGDGNMHFSIEFSPAVSPEKSCGLPSIGGIGSPNPPVMPVGTTASADLGTLVTDGQSISGSEAGNYVVKCTVTALGEISVLMEGPNTSPQASADNRGTVSIKIETRQESNGARQIGIEVHTPLSGTTASRYCELFAVNEEAGGIVVSPGEAHFTFICESAMTALDQFGICKTRGVVYVKDCLEE